MSNEATETQKPFNGKILLPFKGEESLVECSIKTPKIKLAMEYRALSRRLTDLVQKYAARYEGLGMQNAALQIFRDGNPAEDTIKRFKSAEACEAQIEKIQEELSELDKKQYEIQIKMLKLILLVPNATGNKLRTAEDLVVDEIELDPMQEALNFFMDKIAGSRKK